MNIFPSSNEKRITLVILSFFLGNFTGLVLLGKLDSGILITSLATVTAAFIGAWSAYKLESTSKMRKKETEQIENINSLIFAFYERIKILKIYQKQSINPTRDDLGRAFTMPPVLHISSPTTDIVIEHILYLLGTKHRNIILDIHTEKEAFDVLLNLIKSRSTMHLEKIQPAMEKAQIKHGSNVSSVELRKAVGEQQFVIITKMTDDIIEGTDRSINSLIELKDKFVSIASSQFPKAVIFDVQFKVE